MNKYILPLALLVFAGMTDNLFGMAQQPSTPQQTQSNNQEKMARKAKRQQEKQALQNKIQQQCANATDKEECKKNILQENKAVRDKERAARKAEREKRIQDAKKNIQDACMNDAQRGNKSKEDCINTLLAGQKRGKGVYMKAVEMLNSEGANINTNLLPKYQRREKIAHQKNMTK